MPDLEPQESRPYRPERKKRKPVQGKKKSNGSLAECEIDRRLAEAISERAEAMVNVSKLAYWQDRVNRISQEIDSLLNMKQRLMGLAPAPVQNWTPEIPLGTGPSKKYSPHAPISESITSAPAIGPKPTVGNAATDVLNEGGFS